MDPEVEWLGYRWGSLRIAGSSFRIFGEFPVFALMIDGALRELGRLFSTQVIFGCDSYKSGRLSVCC